MMEKMLDAAFFDRLSRLRLATGCKSSMNRAGNRKSVQKGFSTEFSDFREYMPGDDLRRIDWNAYGRLDRLYVKEYMEEKETVVSVLIDTSASMRYGMKSKSSLACTLAAALACMGLNNMDRVVLYDMQNMQMPFVACGGRKALPMVARFLSGLVFEGRVDVAEAVRRLPSKGAGMTILLSDFLQDIFLEPQAEALGNLLRFLNYRKQNPVLLQVLAGEELSVGMTGTKKLIDMEDNSALRLTLDATSIRVYETALEKFLFSLRRACAKAGAFYAVCSTETEIDKLIFEDLRKLYDI